LTLATSDAAAMRRRAGLALLAAVGIAGLYLALQPSAKGNAPGSGAAVSTAAPGRPARLPPRLSPSGVVNVDDDGGAPVADESKGRTVFSAQWGSGKDQLGRDRPVEGNPSGPMSLAVDGKGRVHVLDGINGRVVRRGADGKPETTVPVSLIDPQDMAVGEDGSMAVLDRFVDKSVALYDENGQLRGELPIVGEGVEDVGTVTGVFVDGADVYVEREHGPLVKIGDTSGGFADPRTEIPGRPSRDGLSFLNAGITDAQAGRVYVSAIDRATDQHRFTRELRLKAFVRSIVLLDSDKAGTIYFAAEVEQADGQDMVLLSCLEPLKGTPVGAAVLPVNTLPEESFRDLVVLDEGGVVYALRSEQGVTYVRYDCE